MPASDGGDDFVGIGGPYEGFGLGVVLGDEAVDGCLKVDDRSEDTSLQPPLGELGEEALDGVQPGAGSRHEMEDEAHVPVEPLVHLGMFVGGVVVEDHVDDLAGRHLGVDGIEEADELLMAVPLHVPSDHGAVQHVESGEQGGRAMALVVMGHCAGATLLQRQAGLGAVERHCQAITLVVQSADTLSVQASCESHYLKRSTNINRLPNQSNYSEIQIRNNINVARFKGKIPNLVLAVMAAINTLPYKIIPKSEIIDSIEPNFTKIRVEKRHITIGGIRASTDPCTESVRSSGAICDDQFISISRTIFYFITYVHAKYKIRILQFTSTMKNSQSRINALSANNSASE